MNENDIFKVNLSKLLEHLRASHAGDKQSSPVISRRDSRKIAVCELEAESKHFLQDYIIECRCDFWFAFWLSHKVASLVGASTNENVSNGSVDKKSEKTFSCAELSGMSMKALFDYAESLHKTGNVELPNLENFPPHSYSLNAIRNQRRKMEDRHAINPDVGMILPKFQGSSFFSIFDGHGGHEAAQYASVHFPFHFFNFYSSSENFAEASRLAFAKTENGISTKSKQENLQSGSTAVAALITPEKVFTAWVGDSQAILVQTLGYKCLTPNLHLVTNESECDRVKSAGGMVIEIQGQMRVNGMLQVTRALGDISLKSVVIGEPEVTEFDRTSDDVCVVLACDGLWDALNYETCAILVKQILSTGNRSACEKAAEQLVNYAKEHGSTDNITCIIVYLRPFDELFNLLQ